MKRILSETELTDLYNQLKQVEEQQKLLVEKLQCLNAYTVILANHFKHSSNLSISEYRQITNIFLERYKQLKEHESK